MDYDYDPNIIIKVQDLRDAHICARGAWSYIKRRGLDWQVFITRGLSLNELAGPLPHKLDEIDSRIKILYLAAVARGK